MRKEDGHERQERCAAGWVPILWLGLLLSVPLTGCDTLDTLLETNLPGQILEEDLNDPALAPALVLAAQAEFECALQGHLRKIDGFWAGTYHINNASLVGIFYELRSDQVAVGENSDAECTGRGAVWRPMQIARATAEAARRRIVNEMPEGSVRDADFWIATAYAYEGYATQFLSEAHCGVVFDGDAVVHPREEGFRRAENRFTSALEYARRVTTGPRADEAQEILNMALVGRARARLNLDDGAGVLEDAELVPEGFVRYATYDANPPRRRNGFALDVTYVWREQTVHTNYRNLEVDGVPDPRVPVRTTGTTGPQGLERWEQFKYPALDSDIPFASWREAQLMIAEVVGGQTGVDVINRLRATFELPEFSSSDEAEIRAQVIEERRRELFLQGTKIGDDLRTGEYLNWATGLTPLNRGPYGEGTCIPIPEQEFF